MVKNIAKNIYCVVVSILFIISLGYVIIGIQTINTYKSNEEVYKQTIDTYKQNEEIYKYNEEVYEYNLHYIDNWKDKYYIEDINNIQLNVSSINSVINTTALFSRSRYLELFQCIVDNSEYSICTYMNDTIVRIGDHASQDFANLKYVTVGDTGYINDHKIECIEVTEGCVKDKSLYIEDSKITDKYSDCYIFTTCKDSTGVGRYIAIYKLAEN